MSPLKIRIMLHYYCFTGDYCTNGSKGELGAVDDLVGDKMLEDDPQEGSERMFRVTDKGSAYCEALCNMPLPIAKWIIPEVSVQ